jgi:segregation and condensation protein A
VIPAGPSSVRDLALDLDAFEGPFDLLLTLVLKEELELADVQVAGIVAAFVERWLGPAAAAGDAEPERVERVGPALVHDLRSPADIEICGEFLVLVAALLELKARELLGSGTGEGDLEELDAGEAAAELAERLALYRRVKAGGAWLSERLEHESDRYFRLGPPPLAPRVERPLAPQDPASLEAAIRALAVEPPAPSLAHMALRFPPVGQFLERFRALVRRRRRFMFDDEVGELSGVEQAIAFLALLELRKTDEVAIGQEGHLGPIVVWPGRTAPGR